MSEAVGQVVHLGVDNQALRLEIVLRMLDEWGQVDVENGPPPHLWTITGRWRKPSRGV